MGKNTLKKVFLITAEIFIQRSGNDICLQQAEKQDSFVSSAKVTLRAAVCLFKSFSKRLYTWQQNPFVRSSHETSRLYHAASAATFVCQLHCSGSFSILFCYTPLNVLIFHAARRQLLCGQQRHSQNFLSHVLTGHERLCVAHCTETPWTKVVHLAGFFFCLCVYVHF